MHAYQDFLRGVVAGLLVLNGALPASAQQFELLGDMTSPHGGLGTYQNLLLRSEELDDTTKWARSGNVSVTSDDPTVPAPDGSTSAERIAFSGAAVDSLTQNSGITVMVATYTFSIWLRAAAGAATVQLKIQDSEATPEGDGYGHAHPHVGSLRCLARVFKRGLSRPPCDPDGSLRQRQLRFPRLGRST